MGKLRVRLGLLVGGSVLFALLIIMLAFNVIMSRRMFRNADGALKSQFGQTSAEQKETYLYSPEIIVLFDEDDRSGETAQVYTPKEISVINCCKDMDFGHTEKAETDGNTYYVMRSDAKGVTIKENTIVTNVTESVDDKEQFSARIDSIDGIPDGSISSFGTDIMMHDIKEFVGYVDITGEIEMIRHINAVFVMTALIIGAFGSSLGYLAGKKLEQNQIVQKQFFENTSHELKTPLASIMGYAEGLEKGVITDHVRTGRSIAAQTEKMSRLVEEILCIAKLESGSVKLNRESIDMPAFLQDCLMPFEGMVLSRKLGVSLELEDMQVSADPDKLEHAVTNLLTNALKYAKTRITVSCGDGSFRIQNDCDSIDDDTLSHLFERFYSGRDGNTGIGLALAKEIIELHGWKIAAERTEDGICFVVRC